MDKKLLNGIFIAVFAALVAVCGFIRIPFGPMGIPIVLQNMMAVLCGSLLGWWKGALSVVLFIVAGAIGIPVFSGGRAGIAVLTSPTGGFIFGWILSALITGLICGGPKYSLKKITKSKVIFTAIGIVAGFLVLYVPGVIQFMAIKNAAAVAEGNTDAIITVGQAISGCMLPYLPGDAIKAVVAVLVSLKLRPVCAQYLENTPVPSQD